MVKYFIVIAHPEPKSICQAIGNTAIEALEAAGHEVKVSRLYEQNFDALSTRKNFKEVKDAGHFKPPIEEAHATATNTFADDVEAELQKLEWCDVLIFQFPLYWFSLPAVLKGWVDRVLAFTRTYSYAQMYTTGVFKGKRAILSFTTGGPGAMYTDDGFNGDINGILRPIHRGIFEFVGFSVLRPNILYAAAHGTDDDRKAFLGEWAKRVVTLHEEPAIEVGRYA
jgi:NAD(P)H dehydrogenase (quinone)